MADNDAAVGDTGAVPAFPELSVLAPVLKKDVTDTWRVIREGVGNLLPFGIIPLLECHRWRLKRGQDNVVRRGQLYPELIGAATVCSGGNPVLNHNVRPKGVHQLLAVALGFEVHHLGFEAHLKRGDKILLDLVVRKACATASRERLHLPAIPSVGVYPP